MTKEEFTESNLSKSIDPPSNFNNNEYNNHDRNEKTAINKECNEPKNDIENIQNVNETSISNISSEIYASDFEIFKSKCRVCSLEEFDPSILKKISALFSSEVRAKIYIFLRMCPESTVEEIAEGTNIYSSTVRDYIVEMYRNDYVIRKKIKKSKFGKKPYVYCAIEPTMMARKVSQSFQEKINLLANIDMFFNPKHEAKTVLVNISNKK
ncbi:putative transcriptional regulator [Methanococcus voltae]|uniref:helix-turn-helix domain-containing protein n=1 Tax=Methanococcus voltae TaxID=2188 RepID=UPI001AE3054F|nr:helix-turn-helix domain-containing protein [Methanococcus voltae]MBP2144033.1 putative transcriptional regulator [Methanococcus voltae]